MSEQNNIQKIEEALRIYKDWQLENAELDLESIKDLRLDSVVHILARFPININVKLFDSHIVEFNLPRCTFYKIYYEMKEDKLEVVIYRIYKKVIRMALEIDVEQGIIHVESINFYKI